MILILILNLVIFSPQSYIIKNKNLSLSLLQKKSNRQIKVDNLTHYLLKPLLDNSTSDYIFKYSEDLPRAKHYAYRFKKYCKLAGVKTIRFHDLRHSHAALLIASGEDRFTVSKRLGHASTTFTETIYGHLFPDKQNSITSLLEATFEKDFKKSVQLLLKKTVNQNKKKTPRTLNSLVSLCLFLNVLRGINIR
ncbi:tyrosine-type recombinase/integrase [Listeria welshimeri]|uniref:tyrosine-type recombinase/integrase n=1 Tax=Listeria welshimeri TaxID=1643 RepID=UPI00188892AE|nr:tyrosine-type recombinase/integrase [Listeria welshimeri]MBF2491204.1 tyrosine-type recombinase/integrase [Listeria welshimeri]